MHQSLHHLVADAPWRDEALLSEVRHAVLPAMQKHGSVVAWIVDDTGIPKKSKHSVGAAHQYCGQLGKQENCQVAVSLSVATWNTSLPLAYRLYLPEQEWAQDSQRREKAKVPEEIAFQTKPQVALDQIRQAVEAGVARGAVLTDAAYGNDTKFRAGVTALGLLYAVGVQSSMTVWEPGTQPLPPKPWTGQGRPPKLLRRDGERKPISVKTTGGRVAIFELEGYHLAPRYGARLTIPLCRCTGAPRSPRLLESRTLSRRVATH